MLATSSIEYVSTGHCVASAQDDRVPSIFSLIPLPLCVTWDLHTLSQYRRACRGLRSLRTGHSKAKV
eukprot:5140-Rhodomonas_salina.1